MQILQVFILSEAGICPGSLVAISCLETPVDVNAPQEQDSGIRAGISAGGENGARLRRLTPFQRLVLIGRVAATTMVSTLSKLSSSTVRFLDS